MINVDSVTAGAVMPPLFLPTGQREGGDAGAARGAPAEGAQRPEV